MTDNHEIEIKRAGKRVMLLTAHTEHTPEAWEVKENLEAAYPKEDGYTVTVHRVETQRQRIITIMAGATVMMPKEPA